MGLLSYSEEEEDGSMLKRHLQTQSWSENSNPSAKTILDTCKQNGLFTDMQKVLELARAHFLPKKISTKNA